MTRAVLDSSVLVSAFVKPGGACATLLARAREGAFLLCLSREIVAETAAVLLRAKHQRSRRWGRSASAQFCVLLGHVGEQVEGALPETRAVPGDPQDDMIVATAMAARAGNLVTGDRRHLLPLARYQGVQIITVRDFMELLGRASS